MHIEQLLRHRISVGVVLFLMFMGLSSFDNRVRSMLQEAYYSGWGWIGTYLHHEHPTHQHQSLNTVRIHTISGPG
jgi:hypothetical protein